MLWIATESFSGMHTDEFHGFNKVIVGLLVLTDLLSGNSCV